MKKLREPVSEKEIAKKIPGKNKAESILNKYLYGIPYTVQEFTRDYVKKHSGEELNFEQVFKACYEDDRIDKNDSRYADWRTFYLKIRQKNGKEINNFTDAELSRMVQRGSYIKPRDIVLELWPDMVNSTDQEINGISSNVKRMLDAFGISYQGPKDEFNAFKPTDSDYVPPVRLEQVLKKVNDYVPQADWKANNLETHHRKCLNTLRANLSSHRFQRTINSIKDGGLRLLFEEEFIKNTFNQWDWHPDEINNYINLAQNMCDFYTVNERVHVLEQDFKDCNSTDELKLKAMRQEITKTLTDAIKQKEGYKDSMQKIMAQLNKMSEKRKKEREELSQSIATYVAIFADEKKRARAIAAAKARNEEIAEHIQEVEGYDGVLKGEINGISIEELINYRFEPL